MSDPLKKLEVAISYRKFNNIKNIIQKNKDLVYYLTDDHLFDYFYLKEFDKLTKLLNLLPNNAVQNLLYSNHIIHLFTVTKPNDVQLLYKFIQQFDFNMCRNLNYGDYKYFSLLDVFVQNNCLGDTCSQIHKKVFDILYKKTKNCYQGDYFLNILIHNLILVKKKEINIEFLRTIINKDMLKYKEINVEHPLYLVVKLNHLPLLKLLLDQGVDINLSTLTSNCILNYSLYFGVSEDIVKYILEKNVATNKLDAMYDLPFQSMFIDFQHNKYSIEFRKKLLLKTDINHQDILGNTSLHYICMDDDWHKYSDILRSMKLNIHLKNKEGISVYDLMKEDKDFIALVNNNIINKIQEEDNIKLPEAKYAPYNLSNALLFDIMLYPYFLLKKYNNVSIPYDDNVITPTFDTTKYSIPENVLFACSKLALNIYRDVDQTVHVNPKLGQCIIDNKRDYLFIFIFINTMTSGHANCLIIDKPLKQIVHFEPNGANYAIDGTNMKPMYESIKKYFRKLLPEYKYIYPYDYLPQFGFQRLAMEGTLSTKRINDLGGYCLAWCFWFTELYLNNNHKNLKNLVDKTIKKMVGREYHFKEFIRNYANQMFNEKIGLFKDLQINERFLYTAWFPNSMLEYICKEVNDRTKKLIS